MTIKEQIEVMQAYADGKKVQCKSKHIDDDMWVDSSNPSWNFACLDYRIKHEPKYRPYNDTAEMITDWMERFGTYDTKVVMPPIWVKDRNDYKYHITEYFDGSVGLFSRDETLLIELFKNYTYLDGSPCGKEVTE